jgi:hypothetical protein
MRDSSVLWFKLMPLTGITIQEAQNFNKKLNIRVGAGEETGNLMVTLP